MTIPNGKLLLIKALVMLMGEYEEAVWRFESSSAVEWVASLADSDGEREVVGLRSTMIKQLSIWN